MRTWVWRRLAADDGMSIVEVLVAIIVLGFVLAGFAATLIGSLHALLGQEHRTKGNALAGELLEEFQDAPWDDLEVGSTAIAETRDGVSYTGTLDIAWQDDPSIGGVGEDYLQATLTLEWSDLGQVRSVTHEALRAPPAGAGDPGPTFRVIRADPTLGYLRAFVAGDPANGRLEEAITLDEDGAVQTSSTGGIELTVFTTEPVTSVAMTFEDRDGAEQTEAFYSPGGDDMEWVPTSSTSGWKFPNGQTSFRFEITHPDGSFEGHKVVRFLYPEVLVDGDPVASPQTVCVDDDDHTSEDPVLIEAQFIGLTVHDTVEVSGAGLDASEQWLATHTGSTRDGSAFTFELPAGHAYPDAATTTVTLSATRQLDGETAAGSVELDLLPASDPGCPA